MAEQNTYRVIQNFYPPPSSGKIVCTWKKSMLIPDNIFSLTIICQTVSHETHLFKSYNVFPKLYFCIEMVGKHHHFVYLSSCIAQ